jgi:hypothetical protein
MKSVFDRTPRHLRFQAFYRPRIDNAQGRRKNYHEKWLKNRKWYYRLQIAGGQAKN